MKSLLIIASFVALAVACPTHRGTVAGPAILDEPIAVGPAMVETHPISVGPAIIETEPISVGPAFVDLEPISVGPVEGEPNAVSPSGVSLMQNFNVLLNVDGVVHVINSPINIRPNSDAIVAEYVAVVEAASEPVNIVEAAPEPVQVVEDAPAPIGTLVLPMPVAPEVIHV